MAHAIASPDWILHHGLITTLDRSNPTATALSIKNGKFVAVGHDRDIMPTASESTKVVDLKGRRVLPGLIDNHLHIIRGGLKFKLGLAWGGDWWVTDATGLMW